MVIGITANRNQGEAIEIRVITLRVEKIVVRNAFRNKGIFSSIMLVSYRNS